MRTSIPTFIFIICEYAIITGGDGICGDPPDIGNAEKAKHVTSSTFRMQCKEGYTRKAGTSNLFKCRDSKWANNPSLKCISLPGSTIPSAQASPTTKMPFMTTKNEESNFTTFGKTVFRITHTDYTTSPTSSQTSRRTTTTMRETTVTTSITTIVTASSTTEKENRIRSLSTMSTGNSSTEFYSQIHNKTGIAVGTVILLIACSATTAVVLLWRRRSRPRGADPPVQMRTPDHCTDQLLKKDQKKTESGSPDSIQLAVNPSINSNEGV